MEVSIRKSISNPEISGSVDLSRLEKGLPKDIPSFLSIVASMEAKVFDSKKPLASTKTISEVSCRRAKPFKQKGTGRARQGHGASPLQVGGGIAHGPKAIRSYFSINKKETKKAKQIGFYIKAKNSKLYVFDTFDVASISTKNVLSSISSFCKDLSGRSLFITNLSKDSDFTKSVRNIQGFDVHVPSSITNHAIHKSSAIFITKDCLDIVLNSFSN